MTGIVLTVALLAVAALVAYLYRNPLKAAVISVENKGSAFARVAEQDGKIIALKAVTEVKLLEAQARHVALDEIDKLLG